MAQILTAEFTDINGLTAPTRFWCNDALTAAQALQNLANLSNAQIVSAGLSQPIALSTLGLKNAALAANVETAKSKVKVHLSGADAGSVAKPRADVILSIPAPVGDLINVTANIAALTPFIALVRSHSDVAMDRIDRAFYGSR